MWVHLSSSHRCFGIDDSRSKPAASAVPLANENADQVPLVSDTFFPTCAIEGNASAAMASVNFVSTLPQFKVTLFPVLQGHDDTAARS